MSNVRENVIFGKNPIKESLSANRVKKAFLVEGFSDKSILSLLKDRNITVQYLSAKEMTNLCAGGAHQGVAAEIKPYEYYSLEYVLKKAETVDRPIILLLDGIEDPHNLGAILRSADVFGVSGVIISKHNQVALNSTVAKTSAGAINYVPVVLVNNLNQAIEKLKKAGYWVVSTDGAATKNYNEINYDFKTVVVIGSEGYGVSSLVLKNSDYVVKIPMYGHVNSLNASVAAGILMARIRGWLIK